MSFARWFGVATVVLISFNLRPIFSSTSAVLPAVMASTGLGKVGSGALTMLPVLCLGVFAPLAPRLAARFGTERTLIVAMATIATASFARILGDIPALFAAAGLAGFAISIASVLVPAVVKQRFSDQAALVTGLYTMAVCGGAAAAAIFTPLLQGWLHGSWPFALAAWAVPALVATALLAAEAVRRKPADTAPRMAVPSLLRHGRAWQMAVFMGFQAAMAYTVFGWLPTILQVRGWSAVEAGYVVGVSILGQAFACLFAPHVATRLRAHSGFALICVGLATFGMLGCIFGPVDAAYAFAVLQGLGQGSLIALTMTLIVTRTATTALAASLSGLIALVGYTMAAFGPLLVGALFAATGSISSSGALFLLFGICAAVAGYASGRPGQISV